MVYIPSKRISSFDVYSVIKTELNIPNRMEDVKHLTFQELNIQLMDVNWMLNVMEGKFGLIIIDDEISLQLSIDEFVRIIISQI